jgi:alkylation response protein AidB-like acyl-CoA dehydrogenase
MDFELTPEEKAFQKELHEFLDKECNEHVVAETLSMQGAGPYSKELLRKMGAKRFLAPRWPEEYGGRGMGAMAEVIKVDEIMSHHAPFPLDGVEIGGNALLISGTEEQKKRFLPRVASGEIDIALGYTEPNAGSDIASVQLRAVEDGDHFILNGQKIYNSEAHASEYHWLLTRTDPNAVKKHQGLSMFIVDLKSPGITIRPLYTMAGLRTNEVFYEDVRVPKENMVGEKNGGWAVVMNALYGGGGGGFANATKMVINSLVKYVLEEKQDADENPWIPDALADIYIKTRVGELMGVQATALADLNVTPPYGGGAAVSRLLGGDNRRLLYNTAMQILGPYGQLAKGSKWAPLQGEIYREYMDAPRMTIVHGSQEIQKLLIATRGLGLPRK